MVCSSRNNLLWVHLSVSPSRKAEALSSSPQLPVVCLRFLDIRADERLLLQARHYRTRGLYFVDMADPTWALGVAFRYEYGNAVCGGEFGVGACCEGEVGRCGYGRTHALPGHCSTHFL